MTVDRYIAIADCDSPNVTMCKCYNKIHEHGKLLFDEKIISIFDAVMSNISTRISLNVFGTWKSAFPSKLRYNCSEEEL